MPKDLVFVFRQLSIKEPVFVKNDNSLVIGINTRSILSLDDWDVPFKTLKSFFDNNEYENYVNELLRHINEMGDINTSLKKNSLREVLTYDNESFWDVCQPHIAFELFNDFIFYKSIEKIVSSDKPSQIILLSYENNPLEELVRFVAQSYGIMVAVYHPSFIDSLNTTLTSQYKSLFLILRINWRLFKRTVKALFKSLSSFEIVKDRIISLFIQKDDSRVVSDRNGEQPTKRIIILVFGDIYRYFIKSIPAILKELNENESNNSIKVIRTDALTSDFKKYCSQSNVAFEPFKNYMSKDINLRLKQSISLFSKWLDSQELDQVFCKVINSSNFPFKTRLHRCLKNQFSRCNLIRLMRFKLIIQAIIDKERPHLIVIQEDRTQLGQIIVRQALQKKIPSLAVIPHIMDCDQFWNVFLRFPYQAEFFAVTTKKMWNLLLKSKVSSEKIAVFSNPIYGKLFIQNMPLMSIDEVYSELKIQRSKGIFIFTSQALPESDTIYHLLIEIMKDFPQKHLVIKLHPDELDIRDVIAIKRAPFRNVSLIQDFDVCSLINACELVITISSITALEAMAFKKQVIILELTPCCTKISHLESYPSPYVTSGAALGISSSKDLSLTIKRFVNDHDAKQKLFENMEKFVVDHLGLDEMPTSQRVRTVTNRVGTIN